MRFVFLPVPPTQQELADCLGAATAIAPADAPILQVLFRDGPAFKANAATTAAPGGGLVIWIGADEQSFLDAGDAAGTVLARVSTASPMLVVLHMYGLRSAVAKRRIVAQLAPRGFRMTAHKTNPSNAAFAASQLVCAVADARGTEPFWRDAVFRVGAGDLARELASQPANALYPDAFCARAADLLKPWSGGSTRVGRARRQVLLRCMDVDEMRTRGMELVLAVGAGSARPPRMLVVEARRAADAGRVEWARTVCLVGKGVCFDSGGTNLKPSRFMRSMHTDKTGGAIVVATIRYLLESGALDAAPAGTRVVGVVPLVENLLSGSALKPHDVVRSYSGKTVEIDDTDAEGRLILADAIAYACDEYAPTHVVDFATLTGWASDLFCDSSFAYYTACDQLAQVVEAATDRAGERAVRMPKWTAYARYTRNSQVADLKNHGHPCGSPSNRAGSGYMAAMFLLNFVPERLWRKWLHIDVTHADAGDAIGNANSVDTAMELVRTLLHRD